MIGSVNRLRRKDLHRVKPYGSRKPYGLRFLQQQDAFFSDQSPKAQVLRFLSQEAKDPFMLAFEQPHASMLDDLFPPEQTVLMIHPNMVKRKKPVTKRKQGA